MSDNIAIKVENLVKTYPIYEDKKDRLKESLSLTRKKYHKDFHALNDISFEVKKGETLGIIGQNGSGKSTLLKILTGVLTQTSGQVQVNGKVSALLELGAGFNTEMTGMENIYLNGTIMGYTKEEMDERVPRITDFAGIGDFINQPVKMYSSGMFARLAFAVAINVEPDILIVDEALSVGDVFFQAKCYNKFEEFKKQGKTILFVTHDLGSINKYCDRVLLINKGVNLKCGLPKETIDLFKKLLVNQLGKNITANSSDAVNGDWKKQIEVNPNHIEYGNGMATIVDFCLTDNLGLVTTKLEKGNEFLIKLKVKFNVDVVSPIFAFTIKDIKGNEICGTNTSIENVEVGEYKAEQIIEITFLQELNLQGGEYLLSLGCTGYENESFLVYHRLYDICNITVLSQKNSIGFYDVNSIISMVQVN